MVTLACLKRGRNIEVLARKSAKSEEEEEQEEGSRRGEKGRRKKGKKESKVGCISKKAPAEGPGISDRKATCEISQ